MKEIKDWKFYDANGELKLYVLSDDENGNPVGKVFKLVAEPVDADDVEDIVEDMLEDVRQVPTEGTAGQVLTKYGDGDNAYAFMDVLAVPSGGTMGQVLMKYSDDDGHYRWTNLPTNE